MQLTYFLWDQFFSILLHIQPLSLMCIFLKETTWQYFLTFICFLNILLWDVLFMYCVPFNLSLHYVH